MHIKFPCDQAYIASPFFSSTNRYESAKQYHARLTPMRGRHYGSVFIHYFPSEGWNWTMWDVHVAVPPDFLSPEVVRTEAPVVEDMSQTNVTQMGQRS